MQFSNIMKGKDTYYNKSGKRKDGMIMINATAENFKEEVLEAQGKVLVDFWADWCGPCKMIAPILEEIAAERQDVKIVKVNVDEQMALAMEYKVSAIPSLMVFRDGEKIASAVGAQPKGELLALLG